MTPNELVLTFSGLHLCVKFGENRQRNATVRVMTHGQTDRHTDRQTQTDFIICPIAICYSYGADNDHNCCHSSTTVHTGFYPNATTLRSELRVLAISNPSVVVCLSASVVSDVRALYLAGRNFP